MEKVQTSRRRVRSQNKIKAPFPGETTLSSSGAYCPDPASGGRAKKVVSSHHYTPARRSTDPEDVNDGLSFKVADLFEVVILAIVQAWGASSGSVGALKPMAKSQTNQIKFLTA